jgi:hypothetical protein
MSVSHGYKSITSIAWNQGAYCSSQQSWQQRRLRKSDTTPASGRLQNYAMCRWSVSYRKNATAKTWTSTYLTLRLIYHVGIQQPLLRVRRQTKRCALEGIVPEKATIAALKNTTERHRDLRQVEQISRAQESHDLYVQISLYPQAGPGKLD